MAKYKFTFEFNSEDTENFLEILSNNILQAKENSIFDKEENHSWWIGRYNYLKYMEEKIKKGMIKND